jgi:hypothetical protein
MIHKFINNLNYDVTVNCRSTIRNKSLAKFDVKAKDSFEWDQNEGTSFVMTVDKKSSGKEIIDSSKVERATKITFSLSGGHPIATW